MSALGFLRRSSSRSRADRAQDGPRRLDATLTLADLRPHHAILEIEPGKGWFTGALLEIVGENGSLTVQQPAALDAFFGRTAAKRVERAGLPNASYSDASWEALAPKDGSIDRVVWLQGPHELWFEPRPGAGFGDPDRVFREIARVLKPDGRFTLVDNLAPDGLGPRAAGALHRSVPEALAAIAERAGLRLASEDRDWIGSPVDPLTVPTHDRAVHLRTSQFAQVYALAN